MGWWIALAILVLIAILPLGIRVVYDSGGPRISLVAGPVKVRVFPGKKKKPLPGEEEKKPKKEPPSRGKKRRKRAPLRNLSPPAAASRIFCPWCGSFWTC